MGYFKMGDYETRSQVRDFASEFRKRLISKNRKDRNRVEGKNKTEECCCHHKTTPRQEKELKQLKNRLNRMIGQLNGISKMLDDNRYCGDILTQVAAVESALQAFGYVVLKEHMETCVVEEIKKDNVKIVDEAVELIKKLK
ncbi:metal-sensing transcriptional repressor [Candidatus Acetatifactor stercoripullorum]|uniref:metal-sensing transcriptional repressor n=1 Tax=Candidatus Acetatifactor stercoripullorum TaxID=2838414 RepID=UPI00298EB30F|nr:metal-sensing transcriptional repressor [Candidatus Acetatifactor stercoripullorum]